MRWEWERSRNGIQYLTIPEWSKWGIKVAFSSREGGVSRSPYHSLNLALHVNDSTKDVLHNREIFLAELGYRMDDIVVAEQVHGIKVKAITEMDKGRGMQDLLSAIPKCDSMITSEDVGLMCFFADCVPIYFYCPQIGLIGIAHAGWKGTAHKIVKEVLTRIKLAGGSAEGCYAAIGPCIGACCYEVDEHVAIIFKENFNNVSTILTETAEGKYKLDLVKANQEILISEGILPENICCAELCTACQADHFYSYRRDGITGRMAALIIKEKKFIYLAFLRSIMEE